MKKLLKTIRSRWRKKMPKFFKRMMWICGLISGTALAAHESMELAHIQPHDWWINIEPYLVAVPAGAMFACKFTVNGGFKNDNANDNENENAPDAATVSDGSPSGDAATDIPVSVASASENSKQ